MDAQQEAAQLALIEHDLKAGGGEHLRLARKHTRRARVAARGGPDNPQAWFMAIIVVGALAGFVVCLLYGGPDVGISTGSLLTMAIVAAFICWRAATGRTN
jgi:hypothetical protein